MAKGGYDIFKGINEIRKCDYVHTFVDEEPGNSFFGLVPQRKKPNKKAAQPIAGNSKKKTLKESCAYNFDSDVEMTPPKSVTPPPPPIVAEVAAEKTSPGRRRSGRLRKQTAEAEAAIAELTVASKKSKKRNARKATKKPNQTTNNEIALELAAAAAPARRRNNAEATTAAVTIVLDDVPVMPAGLAPSTFFSETINLDVNSDSEDKSKDISTSIVVFSDSEEEDQNPEINVKIKWGMEIKAYKIRKYQKFAEVFQSYANQEKVDLDDLTFNIENRLVKPTDTPDTINYKVWEFIHGRVFKPTVIREGGKSLQPKKSDRNLITLKIQSKDMRRRLEIDLQKTDTFKILFIKCAEEMKLPLEQIKLSFDGESLDVKATPKDFDLEGGEIIDMTFNN